MEVSDYVRTAFGVERVAVWLAAGVAVAVVVLAVSASGAGIVDPPTASFDGSYDADTHSVTITHAGGDAVSAAQLSLVVTDEAGTNVATVNWSEDGSERLAPGGTLSLDDPTIDADGDGDYFDADRTVGFPLTAGVTVEVRWTGRPLGAAGVQTVTLDTYEVGAN
ncbi:type IV pilin [Halomicrobium mukohataei]|uniref:Type IV pilin n=1 Tax=Halomicrobium mukohataei TaxID=57705 RepID=A0A847UCI7_9EURY|nr:type IV pilin [Halomicrobium mukohataei]NLV11165.1 type IV pilin [Halomicrobium mukohataei]